MMIGRTRVAVGPVRDLGQLDATVGRIGTIPGVERVAVEAFVDRRVLLVVHVLHPVDLAGELRVALRGDLESCAVGGDRVEVVLRGPGEAPAEVVEGSLEDEPVPDWPFAPSGAAPGRAASPWDDDGSPWASRAPRSTPPAVPVRPGPSGQVARAPGRGIGPTTRAALPEVPRPVTAEELLELSFDDAPVAKALVSPDGRWLRVNRRLCALLGRDEDALLSSSLQDLTHPDDAASDAVLLRGLLDGELDRYAAAKRYLHAGGGVIRARLEVAVVRGPDGAVRGLVLEVVDLAAGERARPALAAGPRAA